MDGRHKKPAVLVEEALTLAPGVSHRNAVTVMLSAIEAYIAAGRLQDALAIAGKALEQTRSGGERGSEARARYILAEVRLASDPYLVMDEYREALALADSLACGRWSPTVVSQQAQGQFAAAATM